MKILIKNANYEQWLKFDPVLASGEIGIETDTNFLKLAMPKINGVDLVLLGKLPVTSIIHNHI